MLSVEFIFDCEMPMFMYGRHVADVPYSVSVIGEYSPVSQDGSWEILDISFEDFEGDNHALSGENFDTAKRQILDLHCKLIDRQFDGECEKLDFDWADTVGDDICNSYRDSVYA